MMGIGIYFNVSQANSYKISENSVSWQYIVYETTMRWPDSILTSAIGRHDLKVEKYSQRASFIGNDLLGVAVIFESSKLFAFDTPEEGVSPIMGYVSFYLENM